MKRLLFLAVCLATAATAWAQPRPHYADMYEGNKRIGKQWASGGNARLEQLRDDGTSTIMIYRADSAKIYTLNPDRKIYMVLPMSQATNMNALIGAKVVENANVSRTFKGMQVVDGKECSLYEITHTTTLTDGSTERRTHREWWWEPLNTFIKSDAPDFELRNIVQGAQPASLFEIPRDYTAMALPTGGFMELFEQGSGRSQSEIRQATGEADSEAKSEMEKLDATRNDAGKTEQEKITNALNQLGNFLGGRKQK